jgi:hypothetical protein
MTLSGPKRPTNSHSADTALAERASGLCCCWREATVRTRRRRTESTERPDLPGLSDPGSSACCAAADVPRGIWKFVGRFGWLGVINRMRQGQVRPPSPLGPAIPIDAAWVEAVALRVVQLMRTSAPSRGRLVDAATLASELGVDRSWVYAHGNELGAVRLGAGSKPRLRFDVEFARAAMGQHNGGQPQSGGANPTGLGGSPKRVAPKRRGTPGSVLAVRPRKPR